MFKIKRYMLEIKRIYRTLSKLISKNIINHLDTPNMQIPT